MINWKSISIILEEDLMFLLYDILVRKIKAMDGILPAG